MLKLRGALLEHRHFIVVVTLLTLVMTYPTIEYVFRTDVFWLPTGHHKDAFIKLWDVWYGKLVLTGQADPFFTDALFYPKGVTLAYHPLFYFHAVVVNLFQVLMPLSNAFSLTYLLIIFSTALATYLYLNWLLNDKWLALYGAIIVGISPVVFGRPHQPEISWIATIPAAVFCLHRGVKERRGGLCLLAGLFSGLTSTVTLYNYVCLAILLAFFVCAFAITRWRDRTFWKHMLLLLAAAAVSSAWRLVPMLSDPAALGVAMAWQGQSEAGSDLISYLVYEQNPIFGPIAQAIFQTPDGANMSAISFLGYVPLALVAIGLLIRRTGRKALPWLGLLLVFLLLRLGSTLNVNGVVYENVLLPKHLLNHLLPPVFRAFRFSQFFMAGALLPFAVLCAFGASALLGRFYGPARRLLMLLLIICLAVEYYNPIRGRVMQDSNFAYHQWLAQEYTQNIALINVPMGHSNSKLYKLHQVFSGFPQAEGAISRTPSSAYDYIRSNALLESWRRATSIACELKSSSRYLSAVEQLERDGFTHVVLYNHVGNRSAYAAVSKSFVNAVPAYEDGNVSIYRLNALRESCPG